MSLGVMLPLEEVKQRLDAKWGDLCSYDFTEYKGVNKPITVTCNSCGNVKSISPRQHLKNNSHCSLCVSKNEFIIKATEIHEGFYDYSKVMWNGYHKPIVITCPAHGDFNLMPSSHIHRKTGCQKCKGIVKDTASFIVKANEIHNYKYAYNFVEYTLSQVKVDIVCPKHGIFSQMPNTHISGGGCPYCASEVQGWTETSFTERCFKNFNGLGVFYVLKCYNEEEEFYKIGITSRSVSERYRDGDLIPYNYEVVFELIDDATKVFRLEKYFKYSFKGFPSYKPLLHFDGFTECYSDVDIGYIQEVFKEETYV